MRDLMIGAGFALLQKTRADRLLQPLTGGLGAILMLHHVRPFAPEMPGFAPNRLLEITPDFLDTVLHKIKALGLDLVTMDEALSRVSAAAAGQAKGRRFVTLTFDDGYRDNSEYALPVLRKHSAPFTLFITAGFANHTARLWWLELEAAIAASASINITLDGVRLVLPTPTPQQKSAAFQTLYARLRAASETVLLDTIAQLMQQAGVSRNFARELCLDWDELAQLASEPLITIGAHTLTHPMLAKHDADFSRHEIIESRRIIGERLGAVPKYFAYPVGDKSSAGLREFREASAAGFAGAVTTRPGMLFAAHAARLMALPRLSINGNWQDIAYVQTLLTGAPFALWNRGRLVPGL